MKKYLNHILVILVFGLFPITTIIAQTCPTSGLFLTNQLQVDSFKYKYPGCIEINTSITIAGANITNLNGISHIKRFNSGLTFLAVTNLMNLSGMDSLTFIKDLIITEGTGFKDFKGMEHVKYIDWLTIRLTNKMENLDGLSGLVNLPNRLTCSNNENLKMLELSVNSDTMDRVIILNNPSLIEIQLLKEVKVIKSGTINISNNKRLKNLDCLNNLKYVHSSLIIEDIDSIEYLPNFDSLQFVGLDLTLIGNLNKSVLCKTKNIPLFQKLQHIGRDLFISSFPWSEVDAYSAFNELETVRSVRIFDSDFKYLSGFNKLVSVQNGIDISIISNVSDINGFNNLVEVGSLSIDRNYELRNFTGFKNLKTVRGNVNLYASNVYLESYQGLANLEYVGGKFTMNSNRNLRSLGLKNLSYVGGNFWISDSDRITNVDELATLTTVKGEMYVFHNDLLEDISGLANVDYADVTEIDFRAHPETSFCAIKLFCDYLTEKPTSSFKIGQGNGAGCTTREEVLEQCRLVSTTDLTDDKDIVIYPNPAAAEFYIKVPEGTAVLDVRVYNLSGQLIHYDRVHDGRVDITRLSPGVYMARMLTGAGKMVQRKLVVL
ncbi:MAG: T9SS type A sorting domain-containing protein [Saprospiraceae bacterium]|nr:T9SS type A sorting domain-containing protein [Saprospiraceae bacterium]